MRKSIDISTKGIVREAVVEALELLDNGKLRFELEKIIWVVINGLKGSPFVI